MRRYLEIIYVAGVLCLEYVNDYDNPSNNKNPLKMGQEYE